MKSNILFKVIGKFSCENAAMITEARTAIILLCIAFAGNASAIVYDADCGSLENAYGPFDYNTRRDMLGKVESRHFTSDVENLISGKSSTIPGDIDYTLRASPNHHRALMAISKWEHRQRKKNPYYKTRYYSVECYFDRAIRFTKGKDPAVFLVYAIHYHMNNKYPKAEEQYKKAIALNPEYAEAYYNYGLLLYETKKYDDAVINAKKAYALGYQLPGLKNMLEKEKKWK